MIPRCSGREMEVPPTIPTGPEALDMSGDQVPSVQSPHETEPAAEGHGGGETTIEQSQIPINQELPQLRHSERVIRRPSRYLLYGESFKAVSTEQEEDPTSFKEAMDDIDANHWKSAMDLEMKSMYTNSV
ncbi:Gag/pol protein [Abeliophyllum distichum]|uniref:Gag/pol protein n=1 Tax=Abeliophyllum distichum TaxID=126358 RepID=A0ABD1UQ33_9LAMI